MHATASPALPQGLPTLAASRGRACQGTSVPAVATRTGRFLLPSFAFLAAPGTRQMAACGPALVPAGLLEVSALCGSWTVT